MKLYHYTLKDNVFGMYRDGINECSYWCKSIEDCNKFLSLYMNIGLLPRACDIAYVSIEFDEDEIEESDDHDKNFIKCDAYVCWDRIDKSRMPRLENIPLHRVWI